MNGRRAELNSVKSSVPDGRLKENNFKDVWRNDQQQSSGRQGLYAPYKEDSHMVNNRSETIEEREKE